MVVLGRVAHREDDRRLGIEAVDPVRLEIGARIERQAIGPLDQGRARRQELADAAVRVGRGAADLAPALSGPHLEHDGDAGGRPAARGVEDVGGDAAHDRSFSSRRLVIFRCSSAATRELGLRVVAQALVEESEHLRRALARGADDEDVAEPFLVAPVGRGELGQDVGLGARGAGLLLRRPASRLPGRRSLLADARDGRRRPPASPRGRGSTRPGRRPRAARRRCRKAGSPPSAAPRRASRSRARSAAAASSSGLSSSRSRVTRPPPPAVRRAAGAPRRRPGRC